MSLKLYTLTMGSIERHGVAASDAEMYEKRATIEPSFDYTPVIIEEVKVPGYEITVYPAGTALNGVEDTEDFEVINPLEQEEPPAHTLDELVHQLEEAHEAIEKEEAAKQPTPEEEAQAAILALPFDIETATKAEMTEYLKGKNIGVKSNATVAYLQELVINSLV